jgi:hypothetical protein
MAIYGRSGDQVKVLRRGTLADVKEMDGRKPDSRDRQCVATGAYVVVEYADGATGLYHRAYLRADDGLVEIEAALRVGASARAAS